MSPPAYAKRTGRRSRSADAARADERERLRHLDARQRILLALRLGQRARLLAGRAENAGG